MHSQKSFDIVWECGPLQKYRFLSIKWEFAEMGFWLFESYWSLAHKWEFAEMGFRSSKFAQNGTVSKFKRTKLKKKCFRKMKSGIQNGASGTRREPRLDDPCRWECLVSLQTVLFRNVFSHESPLVEFGTFFYETSSFGKTYLQALSDRWVLSRQQWKDQQNSKCHVRKNFSNSMFAGFSLLKQCSALLFCTMSRRNITLFV